MDIYSFIRSHDVAAYCREIGKTEMKDLITSDEDD